MAAAVGLLLYRTAAYWTLARPGVLRFGSHCMQPPVCPVERLGIFAACPSMNTAAPRTQINPPGAASTPACDCFNACCLLFFYLAPSAIGISASSNQSAAAISTLYLRACFFFFSFFAFLRNKQGPASMPDRSSAFKDCMRCTCPLSPLTCCRQRAITRSDLA